MARRKRFGLGSGVGSLTATGALMDRVASSGSTKPTNEGWQDAAWTHYDRVPELWAPANMLGNMASRCHIVIEIDGPDGPTPGVVDGKPVTPAAAVAMDALADLGDQCALLAKLALCDFIAGESYLVGWIGTPPDGTTKHTEWRAYSTQELRRQGTEWVSIDGRLPPGISVVRIWRAHPARSDYADSALRACADPLDQILATSDAIVAACDSRSMVGLLRIPSEMGEPAPVDVAVGTDDGHPLQSQLVDVASIAFGERRSAARWVPLVVPIPSDIPAHAVQLLDLSRGFADFPAVELLESAVTRLARGLDIPLESTIGHMGTTFANADSIDEALLRDHVAPSVLRIASSISTGYLDEVLVASNMAEGSARYVPDFSELEKDSDRDTLIPVLVKEGVISPAAGREMLGLDESAAPDATATAPATTEVPA